MDAQEVFKVHSILHLIYHRNKNQHRRAKWWKWLAILKRTTLDIGSRDPVAAEPYRQHLAVNLIPRCYLVFSTVVADNQFSTLGVALLAALARLTRATRADRMLNARPGSKMKKDPVSTTVEDKGERINRDNLNATVATREIHESSSKKHPKQYSKQELPSDIPPGTKSTKRAKVTKRKKDAIDDLFSGLL